MKINNKHYAKVLVLILAFNCLLFSNCQSDNKKSEEVSSSKINHSKNHEKLNISILLDLSDRISPIKYPMPNMEMYQRDLGYIKSISNAFTLSTRSKKNSQIDDYMQVYFEPEPTNQQINILSQQMRVHFDKNNAKKEKINEIIPLYANNSSKIYSSALKSKTFLGSDIWTFFKNKVQKYCLLPDHRNILVILTDGYVFHKDNMVHDKNRTTYITPEFIKQSKLNASNYLDLIRKGNFGFIPATNGLENLEVIVLGINPVKSKPFEEDIIKLYWEKWMKDMGVKSFYLNGADLPSNLDQVITKIIIHK